jgi:hypothetical protein
MLTHVVVRQFLLSMLVLWLSGQPDAAPRETSLKPGAFEAIPGTVLGQPIDFENEIDTHRCFPLLRRDEVIAWLHRAYRVVGQLLVQRCVEFDPTIEQTRGNRHGGTKETWEHALVGSNGQDVRFVPLRVPDWGDFANPSFLRWTHRVLGTAGTKSRSFRLQLQFRPPHGI